LINPGSLKLTKLAILVIAVLVANSAPAQTTNVFRSTAGSFLEALEESTPPPVSQTAPARPFEAASENLPDNPTPQDSSSQEQAGKEQAGQQPSGQQPAGQQQASQNSISQQSNAPVPENRTTAAEQLRLEEKQRAMGIVPIFNVTYLGQDTAPLSVGQKFHLAFKSSVDPFVFFASALDAAYSQATDDFQGYGQGWLGYGKRVGASYADTVDGTILGNAVFPSLLHEDPRYYRKGTGTFSHRLLYAVSTTVWCKRDNGQWGPNYANVLGNLTAGGISNLYYPSADRGVGLTFERGFTVTAEGTIGGVFDEFWPDIAKKMFKKHLTQFQPAPQAGSSTPVGSPSLK
jgi:hypothetical protein